MAKGEECPIQNKALVNLRQAMIVDVAGSKFRGLYRKRED
jgi:hypothetical protein